MPLLGQSIRRKIVVTLVAVVGFVLLYEATIRDSRSAREASFHDPTAVPMAGSRLQFAATAYCKGTTTASGVNVRTGIAAADPALLPVGSVISLAIQDVKYSGVYTIMDTGPAVQGRILDLYMWSCHEAIEFGRKEVQVTVLRLGWNPRDSTPSLITSLFRRRESNRARTQAPAPAPVPVPVPVPVQPPAVPAGGIPPLPPEPPVAAPSPAAPAPVAPGQAPAPASLAPSPEPPTPSPVR